MIIALLFLILFAILFPKALRFLFVLLFIGGIMLFGGAHAAEVDDCDKVSLRLGNFISIGADECDNAILRARVPDTIARDGRVSFCRGLDTYMTHTEDTGILELP